MKKNTIVTFSLFAVFALGCGAATAQITIQIPKIPKIKKEKQEIPKQDQQTTQEKESPTNDADQSKETPSNDNRKTENETKKSEQDSLNDPSGVYQMWFEEIEAAVKEAEEYTPQSDRAIYTYSGRYDWGLIAVSPSARNEWFGNSDFAKWRKVNPGNKFDAAFDKLAALLVKHLPGNRGSLESYKFRNPADEKVMKTIFEDITRYQVYSYGIRENSWLIEKDNYNFPTARYKHAVFYLRDKKGDHPYCYLTFVNIIQDYAGGGTYAASRARFIEDQLVGCPAGAK